MVIMIRKVALVSLLSLSVCFTGCAEDDNGASLEASEPSAATAEGDAGSGASPQMPAPAAPQAGEASPDSPAAPALGADADAAAPEPPAPSPSIDPDAGASSDAGAPIVVVPVFFGVIHASEASGATCNFTVDGVSKGTSTTLDLTTTLGTHDVTCLATDGRATTQSVTVALGQTANVVLHLPVLPGGGGGNGTLVAVAVGGSCTFSVNGANKGTSSQLKLSVPAGTYSVSCKPGDGTATKSRSVIIKSGETAMAMFKLN